MRFFRAVCSESMYYQCPAELLESFFFNWLECSFDIHWFACKKINILDAKADLPLNFRPARRISLTNTCHASDIDQSLMCHKWMRHVPTVHLLWIDLKAINLTSLLVSTSFYFYYFSTQVPLKATELNVTLHLFCYSAHSFQVLNEGCTLEIFSPFSCDKKALCYILKASFQQWWISKSAHLQLGNSVLTFFSFHSACKWNKHGIRSRRKGE